MEFKITGHEEGSLNEDGTARETNGGTEMMKEGLLERLPPELSEQFNIICSRVREVSEDKKNILWLHDTWNDPESQHLRDFESRSRFEKLVFVSNYQFQTYHLAHQIPYSESVVLKNAIEPIPEHKKPKDGPIRLIYHTTPHRGLELLVPSFEYLYEEFGDKIELDVYSSFSIYGWPQRDEQYASLFDRCREHPGINYHGTVSNEKVREALQRAHIFSYPNIWPETSCIAAIEALSAGCAMVCPNHAALPETTGGFASMYQWNEDPNYHANQFTALLKVVIENYWDDRHANMLKFQKHYIDSFYSWDGRIPEWKALLESLG